MQPRNAERPGYGANRPLPTQLARSLGPRAQRALMHGTRRGILRILNQDPTPRTTQDLMSTSSGVSLSTVTYHVLVLSDCGSLRVSSVKQAGGTFTRSFVSNVVDDAQIVAVLKATEQMDDVH
jgi:DNA-binding transcriptional ArsR family regulator